MCICLNEVIPFGQIDDKCFFLTQKGIKTEHNIEDLNFKINTQEKHFMKQISNLIIENTDPENEKNFFL